MPKSSRKQKLSKEELKEENKRLRAEMAKTTEIQGQQQILDLLCKENWIAYLTAAFLPPIGIWYIWAKRDKHKLTFASMIVWTMIACIIMFRYCQLIFEWFNA